MPEPMTNQTSDSERDERIAAARSQRVTTAAWLAGITAVIALGDLKSDASLGAGLAVVGVSTMVAFVCFIIVRDK